MKKSYTALLFALSLTATITAQNRDTKKADQLYEKLEYASATEAYEKLVDKGRADTYVYLQLANSYYLMNDSKEAEKYFEKVLSEDNASAETMYRYSQTLRKNGNSSKANQWMENFARQNPNDSRAQAFMKDKNYLEKLLGEEPQYTVVAVSGINSEYSDFGGFIQGEDFYFASARNTKRGTYGWNSQPYLDIYQAKIVGETIQDPQPVKGDVNTKYHESSVSISPDGNRMYFDRNDYYKGKFKRGEDGINQIHIYYAENVSGEWKDIQKTSFNDENHSTGHPAVSPDGKWLYFSSDRDGGQGDSDIYRVSIEEDGSFGTPENLPTHINTEGKEVFPFVDSEGTLYFSSDGHPGLGGLDVFYAEAEGNGFGEVKNMGAIVNSNSDDFAFHYDIESGKGFVSSDRSANTSDDIYSVERIEVCEPLFVVTVKDSRSMQVLNNVRLVLLDENQNLITTTSTDNMGQASFNVDCDKEYYVEASTADYEDNAITFQATRAELVEQDILMDSIIVEDKIVINPIHFDFDKSDIKPEAALELDRIVAVMDKYPAMIVKVEAHSDSQGNANYNLGLSDRRAKATVEYIISQGVDASRISGEGFGATRPVVDCKANCTEEDHAANRRSDFIIVEK